MLKPFPSHQKTKAIYNSTNNNNNSNEFYNFSHQYSYHHSHSYHQKKSLNTTTINSDYFQKRTLLKHKSKHQKQNTFFIIIVGLLSLCSVTVSSQVSRAQNISNLVAQIVSPADPFNSTPIHLNESWWPTNIPLELYHSNRGTLQQQIIGVPPSWGVGCPTPGNTPPVRGISSSSDDNNNNTISDNKLNQETKLEQIENDNSPYYSCPAPCPLTATINNIKMDSAKFNSPSFKNDDDDVNDSSTNSYSSKPINQEQKGEQKFKHPPYFNQCLHYLQPSVFETLCKKDNQSIYEFGRKISKLRLPFCCEHTVESVVMASLQQPDFNVMIEEVDDFNNEVPVSLLRNFECIRHLESLLTLDRLARKAAAMFDSVLERYDCGQTYSVNFRCEDCKDAYRRWVCASLLPYHEPHRVPVWPAPSAVNPAETKQQQQQEVGTGRSPRPRRRRRAWRKVRPCRVVCQQVEQRCPFFLPGDRAPGYTTQYAGEPTFLCLDPNIPETGEQYERSAYGHDECCYRYCDTAESVASMLRKSEHPIQRQRKQGRLHGVCSTTTACDQRELLLVNNNNNKINNNINNYNNNNNSRRIDSSLSSSSSSLNTSSTNLISSSSSTSNNNNNNENNNNYSHNKQPHHQLQCSQLTNEEKVHQKNCAVSPSSSQQTNTQQQSVNTNNKYNKNKFNNNDNNPFHHHHEVVVDSFEDAKTSSGDVINSAGVSFIHIHSLNNATALVVARQTTNRLLLLLFKNNDNNNNITDNSITISNRLSSSFLQWWWFSIVTIIIRIINLSNLFLAHLPYMLLFLLVHTRTTEGYL